MSPRRLSDEEKALWNGYVSAITPLRRGAQRPKAPAAAAEVAPPRPQSAQAKRSMQRNAPLVPLGRRLRQRVARGRQSIDARLDLHGMTQSRAHAALLHFLRRAQADSAQIVLIVTGKGTGGGEREPHIERGVLKRQVPIWLGLPEFRPLIVGFEDADVGHGGQGALYVRLRRPR
jgi:DNA-nicking Smr family endonuclease